MSVKKKRKRRDMAHMPAQSRMENLENSKNSWSKKKFLKIIFNHKFVAIRNFFYAFCFCLYDFCGILFTDFEFSFSFIFFSKTNENLLNFLLDNKNIFIYFYHFRYRGALTIKSFGLSFLVHEHSHIHAHTFYRILYYLMLKRTGTNRKSRYIYFDWNLHKARLFIEVEKWYRNQNRVLSGSMPISGMWCMYNALYTLTAASKGKILWHSNDYYYILYNVREKNGHWNEVRMYGDDVRIK